MRLFSINGKDLTHYITVPSYIMNSKDVYNEWVDANGLTHRDVYRTKVSGKFTMLFTDHDEYFDFLKLINEHKGTGGYVPVSLYVNNLNTIVNTDVYIEMEPANTLPYFGINKYDGFEVSIVER